jgi:coproporphyrinogen III oxidase-like Fe-S oxidoreductase
MAGIDKKQLLLNINIPFCFHQCAWCARNMITDAPTKNREAYVQALRKEAHANAAEFEDCHIAAIRINGGTASTVPAAALERLVRDILREYDAAGAEISLQALPGSISVDHLTYYRRAGVSRYELQAFSMEYSNSVALGVLDIRDVLPLTLKVLHMAHCANISALIAYGVRGQNLTDFRRSLIRFIHLEFDHLTLKRCANDLAAGEDETCRQFELARELFTRYGYSEYAPGSFARPDKEDRFTLLKHQGMDVLSFGLGARSRVDGARVVNTSDLPLYLAHSDDYTQITVAAGPLDKK